MARFFVLISVLCFFCFAALVSAGSSTDVPLSLAIRTVDVNPVNNKINFVVSVETDASLTVPTLRVTLDGKTDNSVIKITGNPNIDQLVTVILDVSPITPKSKKPVHKTTGHKTTGHKTTGHKGTTHNKGTGHKHKNTNTPVSDASVFSASPIVAASSLVIATVCRGFTRSNKLSIGIFLLATLILAFATSSDAELEGKGKGGGGKGGGGKGGGGKGGGKGSSSKGGKGGKGGSSFPQVKNANLIIFLPTGWTSDAPIPFDVTIGSKVVSFPLAPPTPSPSGTPSRSPSGAVSSSPSITATASPSVSVSA